MIQISTIEYAECESSYPELLATVKEIAPGLTEDEYAELVTLAAGICQDCCKHERSDCEPTQTDHRALLPHGAASDRPRWAYFPFGGGTRICAIP